MKTATDNLCLYDPEFDGGAKRFANEMGGSSNISPITSSADIGTCMKNFTNVKFLVFHTHGSPGMMSLPDGTNFEGVDFVLHSYDKSFLAKDARVLFLGCNIGEGSAGDTFLRDVGKFLLQGKGGTVGATTSINMSFQFGSLFSSETYMVPLSFGRLKVKRYSDAGSEVGSMTVDRHGWKR